jgi:hypothetical protein
MWWIAGIIAGAAIAAVAGFILFAYSMSDAPGENGKGPRNAAIAVGIGIALNVWSIYKLVKGL